MGRSPWWPSRSRRTPAWFSAWRLRWSPPIIGSASRSARKRAAAAAPRAPAGADPDSRLDLTIENRTAQSTLPVRAHPRIVSTDFFQTMGIPLLRGRVFTDRDMETSGNVAIVNEASVKRYWPGENPIGQRISLG